jgi:hypothetical protein
VLSSWKAVDEKVAFGRSKKMELARLLGFTAPAEAMETMADVFHVGPQQGSRHGAFLTVLREGLTHEGKCALVERKNKELWGLEVVDGEMYARRLPFMDDRRDYTLEKLSGKKKPGPSEELKKGALEIVRGAMLTSEEVSQSLELRDPRAWKIRAGVCAKVSLLGEEQDDDEDVWKSTLSEDGPLMAKFAPPRLAVSENWRKALAKTHEEEFQRRKATKKLRRTRLYEDDDDDNGMMSISGYERLKSQVTPEALFDKMAETVLECARAALDGKLFY